MTTAPTLPTGPFAVSQTRQLPWEHDAVDAAWLLWWWLTSGVDLAFVGLAVFVGRDVFIMGYDSDVRRWNAVARVDDSQLSEPDLRWAGLANIEAWLYDRFKWDQLTRF